MARTERAQQIGEVLRWMREDARLSQTEVGAKLGKGQSWVSKVEIGMQPILLEEWIELCDLYGVSPTKAAYWIDQAVRR